MSSDLFISTPEPFTVVRRLLSTGTSRKRRRRVVKNPIHRRIPFVIPASRAQTYRQRWFYALSSCTFCFTNPKFFLITAHILVSYGCCFKTLQFPVIFMI
ncbi:hypothetical protein HanPSC8_Chr15g0661821 [Helianthus annuus]|uniref:Uncharacterized protein n=1 Tax=Helianthus annuus TaxID=4232 RepID=A0A251TDR2_HELAN|nr:hypothetical protein HanPSC8_Chr15g0661821 [Helianthus annuus]